MYTSRGNACKSNIAWCLLRRQQSRLSFEEKRTVDQYAVCQTTLIRRAISCKFSGTPQGTFFLAFSADGKVCASGHNDHLIRVSEIKSGRCLHVLDGHPRSVWCIVFHPSNACLLASGCLGGVVQVWNLQQRDCKVIGSLHLHGVMSLAFHPTDSILLITTDNHLLFWSWDQPEPFAKVRSPSLGELIRVVMFDSLGHHILTGIRDLEHASVDDIDYQVRKDVWTSRTSVVHVNSRNTKTAVDHVTEQVSECSMKTTTLSNRHTPLYRLQWWDFTNLKIPNLQQRKLGVVARNCKLYNNNSVDISSDGRLLSALVVKFKGSTELCKVCVFSLEKNSAGECLFSVMLGSNTLSTCFSPLNTHILVGIASLNKFSLFQKDRTVAYIFNICTKTNASSEMATLKLRKSGEERSCMVKANAVVWHPIIGHGLIAFGTNKGEVYFCCV